MRVLAAIGWCLAGLVITLLSVPWIFLALGYGIGGDDEAFDRVIAKAPIVRLMDWRMA